MNSGASVTALSAKMKGITCNYAIFVRLQVSPQSMILFHPSLFLMMQHNGPCKPHCNRIIFMGYELFIFKNFQAFFGVIFQKIVF